jgi:hypothetical protein
MFWCFDQINLEYYVVEIFNVFYDVALNLKLCSNVIITLHSLDPKLVKMTLGYGTSHTFTFEC